MSCTLAGTKKAFQAATPTASRIVVVDSQFDDYRSLASAAQHGLCTVHFRSSGAAARRLLSKHPADAVIVGVDLDDMSGQDFVDLLGASATSRPVVLMAAEHGRPIDGDAVVRHPVLWRDVDNHFPRPTVSGHAVARAALVMRALNSLPVGASIAALAFGALLLR